MQRLWQIFRLLNVSLDEIDSISASFFITLIRTGMRANEALGISLKDVHPGKLEGGERLDQTHSLLQHFGIDQYNGYVAINSQPKLKQMRQDIKSENASSVPRKPLKHRKSTDARWMRFIPVFQEDAWDAIKQLYNKQIELFERKLFGTNEADYLLFDGLTMNKFRANLNKAFRKVKLKPRKPHCCRHTFLTWLYGKTFDNRILAERIAGHTTERMIQRYSHVREQIGVEQARKKTYLKKIL